MNILINGGSRGIGRETALMAASDRDNLVLVTGRDVVALRALSEAAEAKNIEVFGLDTTIHDERLKSLENHIRGKKLKIDVIINFAGHLVKVPFVESDEGDARRMMEVNFFGPVFFIKKILPLMNNPGHIVNIGSMGGFQGSVKFPGLAWYSASKAALVNITESLAAELTDYGISVNCICPGAVQTGMLEKAFPGYRAPLSATEAARFIADFSITGHRYFNGKIIPFSRSTP